MNTTIFNPVITAKSAYRLAALSRLNVKKSLKPRGKSLNRPKSTLEEVSDGMKKRAREKALRGGK